MLLQRMARTHTTECERIGNLTVTLVCQGSTWGFTASKCSLSLLSAVTTLHSEKHPIRDCIQHPRIQNHLGYCNVKHVSRIIYILTDLVCPLLMCLANIQSSRSSSMTMLKHKCWKFSLCYMGFWSPLSPSRYHLSFFFLHLLCCCLSQPYFCY